MSIPVDKVVIDQESVLIQRKSVPGNDDAFDVCVTSIYGDTYTYARLDDLDPLTEQQASKLADRVRDARHIDPSRWSFVQKPEEIFAAIIEMRYIREYAKLSQILLLKLKSEGQLSPQAMSLLVLYVQYVSEETVRNLGRAGLLHDRWPSAEKEKAMADMHRTLFGLWNKEVERAEAAGTTPESICHAGYRIGIDHPAEVIGSGDDVITIEVSEDIEGEGLPLIWIDNEYDGDAQ
jgi:hypothetical protein